VGKPYFEDWATQQVSPMSAFRLPPQSRWDLRSSGY